jgi:hypothetical protein
MNQAGCGGVEGAWGRGGVAHCHNLFDKLLFKGVVGYIFR